jgi:virulence-associated protein VagC
VRWTSQGLLIPRAILQDLGEVEVLREQQRIVIQPKSLPTSQEREAVIEALRQDGLLVEVAWEPLSPPATTEERQELAAGLSVGPLLSDSIKEERQAGG